MDCIACQAPLSMGFPRQEYWSGLPFTPPGDLPNPGVEPMYPMANTLQVDSFTGEPLGKPLTFLKMVYSVSPGSTGS